MELKKGVTIFTPTYNRENTLSRLYDSLKRQKCKDFEWLIVDDGSKDNTRNVVNEFIKENKIKIRYVFQENQGKPTAHNTGVINAKYNLFFCVDSDDYVADNVVELINRINDKIYNNKNIVGLIGYKHNIKKEKKDIKINVEYTTVANLYNKHRYKGEAAMIYKTDLLKNVLFPKIEGEKFIPEAYLYDKMDILGKCYILQEYIYYYEYFDDGYTANTVKLLKNNINGYLLFSKHRLLNSNSFEYVVRGAIQYNIACLIANKKWGIEGFTYKILLLFTWLPAYIYYLKKYK